MEQMSQWLRVVKARFSSCTETLHNLSAQEGTLGQPGQSFHGLTLGRAIPTAQTQYLLSNVKPYLTGCRVIV